MPNVHTRPLALRDEAFHRAENWLTAFGALIPADQIENLAISLAADLAKPAIDEVERLDEQIAAVRDVLTDLGHAPHCPLMEAPDRGCQCWHGDVSRALGVTK